MNVTLRKGIPKFIAPKLDGFIKEAMEFLIKRYPHINFDAANLYLSYNRKSANFSPPEKYERDSAHKINVCIGTRFRLYRKMKVGLTTPIQGLNAGYEISTVAIIIHEMTHYVQFVENRPYSEVETTMNEIEYLKSKSQFWYSQLVPCKSMKS